jgi:hypothetical protein
MKKIKIMLSALAVLAVVGGALAFKAKNAQIWCDSIQHFGNDCPLYDDHTLDANGTEQSYCTTAANSSCTVLSTITFQD